MQTIRICLGGAAIMRPRSNTPAPATQRIARDQRQQAVAMLAQPVGHSECRDATEGTGAIRRAATLGTKIGGKKIRGGNVLDLDLLDLKAGV
jgi:hypothetical protein